jgi:hypothetical protein
LSRIALAGPVFRKGVPYPLCEKELRSGRETILKDWKIRLVIKNSRGRIQPVLNWDLENLRYVIRMRGFGDIGIGIWRRPYGS